MEAKPFYPLVSVVRNGTTSVKKLKAWQFPDTGDVTWQLLDIIIILCSTIDVGAKTFRISHALKKIPVWKPLLQRLGQETSDHHFPSLKSFAQRKNTDAVTEKHRERASVSTYGLLLLALVVSAFSTKIPKESRRGISFYGDLPCLCARDRYWRP